MHFLPQPILSLAHRKSKRARPDFVWSDVSGSEHVSAWQLMILYYSKDILLILGSFAILGSTITMTQVFGYAVALTVGHSCLQPHLHADGSCAGSGAFQNARLSERSADRTSQQPSTALKKCTCWIDTMLEPHTDCWVSTFAT